HPGTVANFQDGRARVLRRLANADENLRLADRPELHRDLALEVRFGDPHVYGRVAGLAGKQPRHSRDDLLRRLIVRSLSDLSQAQPYQPQADCEAGSLASHRATGYPAEARNVC